MTQIFTSLTERELRELITEQVQTAVKPLMITQPANHPEKPFLTRKETAELLGVSLATLHLWEKAGILKPKRIGRRVLYTMEAVREAVTKEKAGEQALTLK